MCNRLITQLARLDKTFKSDDKALMLSVSLPKKYNTVMTSLLVGKTTLDLDETMVVLLEAEKLLRQSLRGYTGEGEAYAVEARGRKKRGKKKHSLDIKCFYCHEKGHVQSNCPKAKEDLKKLKEAKGKRSALFEIDESEEDVLIVEDGKGSKDEWVLDSQCSHFPSLVQ